MRKRGQTIRHRARAVPPIVATVVEPRYEMALRQCVEAFRGGYATGHHHADLADARDLMLVALDSGLCREDRGARVMVEFAGEALRNILDRHAEVGKWGATGDELAALEVLADTSMDFWSRRSGALYSHAWHKLRAIRVEQCKRVREAA